MCGMESIYDLDDPILQHDFCHFVDPSLFYGGEVVGDLEGSTLLVGQFDFDVMLMGDYVVLVLEILREITRGRLTGHQYVHHLLARRLSHPAIKK